MRIYQPAEGPDRLPQAMVEAATEYDWAELPEWLKRSIRDAATDLRHWAAEKASPLEGELANEVEA